MECTERPRETDGSKMFRVVSRLKISLFVQSNCAVIIHPLKPDCVFFILEQA